MTLQGEAWKLQISVINPWSLNSLLFRAWGLSNISDVCITLWPFSSVQSLSCVWLFATPWITAHQASLSITNSQSSLKLMSIESVMPSSHLILCRPLRLLPPIPPSIRVFSSESTLHMRWPKYWSSDHSLSLFLTFTEVRRYYLSKQKLQICGQEILAESQGNLTQT